MKSRFHNLDFLRAFAMMMGLVIHAPILFTMPDVARDFQIENIPALESWGWLVMVSSVTGECLYFFYCQVFLLF